MKAYEVAQISTIILYALTTLFGALLIVPVADLIILATPALVFVTVASRFGSREEG